MEKAFKNWRIAVLAVLSGIATILIVSEEDASILVKIAGFAIAFAVYRLFRYWQHRGELKELTSLMDEE